MGWEQVLSHWESVDGSAVNHPGLLQPKSLMLCPTYIVDRW